MSSAVHRQPDLFVAPQSDLFGGGPETHGPRSYAPSLDLVRAHLESILAQARAAATMPWEARKAGFYKQVVPQMTLWLPDAEAAQWRLDFECELKRLEI